MSDGIISSAGKQTWTTIVVNKTVWKRAVELRFRREILRALASLICVLGRQSYPQEQRSKTAEFGSNLSLRNGIAAISYFAADGCFFVYSLGTRFWAASNSDGDDTPPAGVGAVVINFVLIWAAARQLTVLKAAASLRSVSDAFKDKGVQSHVWFDKELALSSREASRPFALTPFGVDTLFGRGGRHIGGFNIVGVTLFDFDGSMFALPASVTGYVTFEVDEVLSMGSRTTIGDLTIGDRVMFDYEALRADPVIAMFDIRFDASSYSRDNGKGRAGMESTRGYLMNGGADFVTGHVDSVSVDQPDADASIDTQVGTTTAGVGSLFTRWSMDSIVVPRNWVTATTTTTTTTTTTARAGATSRHTVGLEFDTWLNAAESTASTSTIWE
jgi:hypothetical protein